MAALLIGKWMNEIGLARARATLSGDSPFDELSLEQEVWVASTKSEEGQEEKAGVVS